jgi:hypothetical protein
MKLDPGIHIVKHLVFFGKSGVTPTAALGRHAWVLARVRAVSAGFAARAPMVREGDGDQGSERGK